jgi:cytochrome b pre-mRNA-processing protein 3
MVLGLFGRKNSNRRIVEQTYAALTEAGRHPQFYERMGVPDTVMGRFEMIAVHMVLFLRRTTHAGPAARALAQDVVDAFFQDIDHSIREIGIGDMGVPKRMKKFARMFYGRYESYDEALSQGDCSALAAALGRNVHPNGAGEAEAGLSILASHLMDVDAAFRATGEADILAGELIVPPPEGPADRKAEQEHDHDAA